MNDERLQAQQSLNGHGDPTIKDFQQFRREIGDMVANALFTSRSELWGQLLDRGRKIDEECDYPPSGSPVGVELFKQLYDREPIAARVVQVLPMETWQVTPQVRESQDSENPTEFDKDLEEVNRTLSINGGKSWHSGEQGTTWQEYLMRLDVLAGIGQFGVLLFGLDDGKPLQEPVDGSTVVVNSFCATGEGGGVDPTCSPGSSSASDSKHTADELQAAGVDNLTSGNCWVMAATQWEKLNRAGKDPVILMWNGHVEAAAKNDDGDYVAYTAIGPQLAKNGIATKPGGRTMLTTRRPPIQVFKTAQELVDYTKTSGYTGANYETTTKPALEKASKVAVASWTLNIAYMHDSPMHEEEEAAITNAAPQKVWSHYDHNAKRHVYSEVQPIPLTAEEKRLVERWGEERKAVQNKIAQHASEVAGTDRQYFEQGSLGMSPMSSVGGSIMGTDRQYMGVQFGASEVPSDKPRKKGLKLLFLRAFDESLVQVVRYEWNVNNPRFGMPVMYRITLNDPRRVHSGVGLPMATVFVHWSRVLHYNDTMHQPESSDIFSPSRLQPVLNRVLDVRKVSAAGGEGYWQSCFAAISLETHPALGGDVAVPTGLEQMMTDFRNKLRRDLLTTGMTAKTLPPSVVDPSPFLAALVQQICIKIPCPKRVFDGTERGELASSQDDAQWNDVVRGRQNMLVTPRLICPFIDKLIQLGVVSEPGEDGYFVDWPDLDSLNDIDKATVALTIAQAIAAFVGGNGEAAMTMAMFLKKAFSGFFTDEEVDDIVAEAEKMAEDKLADQQALADEHGFKPAPPDGFEAPPPPTPPHPPIKVKPGEKLVQPPTDNAFDPDQARDADGKWSSSSATQKLKDLHGTKDMDNPEWDYGKIDQHFATLSTLPHAEVKEAAKHIFGDVDGSDYGKGPFGTKGKAIAAMKLRFKERLASHHRTQFDRGVPLAKD